MPELFRKGITLPCGRLAPVFPILESDRFEKWHADLKTYFKKTGLKYSEQRWKIAKLILERRGHFHTQEIVQEVTRAHPGLGAATVYRNLKILCDAKILKETLVDAAGRAVYESYDEAHHDHIVCLDCNEIFEFHNPVIESQQEAVAKSMEFKEVRHRHIIYAHCELKKKKSPRKN
jgi:Fur family transcriptional regulator, ferric uptake regulator